MSELDTKYMALELKSPLIVSSSPLTASIENLKKCQDYGAGAVVLKSIFEEQIEKDAERDASALDTLDHNDNYEYFTSLTKDYYIEKYAKLIKDAKNALDIPVIASINCSRMDSWIEYAERFIASGADAIELNYFPVASDSSISGEKVDKALFFFAEKARKSISCPLSIKLSSNYSSLSYITRRLDELSIDSLVFFNRAFRPDIDLDTLSFRAQNNLSENNEYSNALRWIALMSAEVSLDFAANTGIHDADTAVKMLLAGAKAVEICSVIIKEGFASITRINEGIKSFMKEKGYANISEFTGLLAQENHAEGYNWERVQFLKTIR